jgi:membrane-bound lytic murein transglycosylase B
MPETSPAMTRRTSCGSFVSESFSPANFQAMYEWNRAPVCRKTIGYFADRLMGR